MSMLSSRPENQAKHYWWYRFLVSLNNVRNSFKVSKKRLNVTKCTRIKQCKPNRSQSLQELEVENCWRVLHRETYYEETYLLPLSWSWREDFSAHLLPEIPKRAVRQLGEYDIKREDIINYYYFWHKSKFRAGLGVLWNVGNLLRF